MINIDSLEKIKESVLDLFKGDTTGHDFFHIQRVVNNTKVIASEENVDVNYCLALAYLHDVGDYKLHNGEDKSVEGISGILQPLGYSEDYINTIIRDVSMIGFRGGFQQSNKSTEVQVVQDADRLDAMGAIGIARAFAYGGSKGRALYNPKDSTEEYKSAESYQNSKSATIQHFYDKLLKLKDLMNTQAGKRLAKERHKFMLQYLEQFYTEWEGNDIHANRVID